MTDGLISSMDEVETWGSGVFGNASATFRDGGFELCPEANSSTCVDVACGRKADLEARKSLASSIGEGSDGIGSMGSLAWSD
jgi:hypothetical protein